MKIDLYCVGMCRDDGEPTQLAGCGIVVASTDDHNRTKYRTFKYALGNSTQDLADLQAVRLALSSVKSAFRDSTVVLHTDSPYAARMLEPVETLTSMYGYGSEVTEVRRWYGYYDDISVVVEDPDDVLLPQKSHDSMVQAKDLAKMGLATQEHSDSGTLEGL